MLSNPIPFGGVAFRVHGNHYEATFFHAHFTPEYVADKIGFEAATCVYDNDPVVGIILASTFALVCLGLIALGIIMVVKK